MMMILGGCFEKMELVHKWMPSILDLFYKGQNKGLKRVRQVTWAEMYVQSRSWISLTIQSVKTCELCDMRLWLVNHGFGALWASKSLELREVQQQGIWKNI